MMLVLGGEGRWPILFFTIFIGGSDEENMRALQRHNVALELEEFRVKLRVVQIIKHFSFVTLFILFVIKDLGIICDS